MIRILVLVLSVVVLQACSGRSGGVSSDEEGAVKYNRVLAIGTDKMTGMKADTLDFGRLKEGEVMEYRIGLKNTDTVSLVILSVSTDCGCTSTDFGRKPVQPGDTTGLTLRYDSRGQHGWQLKGVRVRTSLSSQPYEFMFTAQVE